MKKQKKIAFTVYVCPKCNSMFIPDQAESFNFCPVCRHQKKPYFPKHIGDSEEDKENEDED